MKILHIGDFHFRQGKKHEFDQISIVDNLVSSLKDRNEEIDYIFFTGDLVYSGNNPESFKLANELLFNKLKEELNISSDRIFICPGNHDVNRDEISDAIISYFDKSINSNNDLNDYCAKPKNKDLKNSFTPLKNYFNFLKENYVSEGDIVTDFYTIHKRASQGIKIAIATLNSAWLSSDRNDQNKLLIPTQAVKDILNEVRDCPIKIILVHHPLHWLKEENYIEIEDLIHSGFNLMFSGHVHKEKIESNYNANNGIYCNTTQATLTYDVNGEIGYTLLEYDVHDECSITIDRSHYLKKERKFINLDPVILSIPCGAKKSSQNKLRQKITMQFSNELLIANDLLLNYSSEENNYNFIQLFTNPVLSKNSDAQTLIKDKDSLVSFETLLKLEDNYLLYGKDKCGKSSILKMIQLHLLKNYTRIGLIPFYIDYKEIDSKGVSYEIEKAIERYYQINKNDAKRITEDGNLVLLIDNLNSSSHIHATVLEFLETHSQTKFVACSEWITSRIFHEELDHLDYTKLFFHDITRNDVRSYTEKQSNLKADSNEKILEKITTLCKQLKLPLNYWTVSLILLIYKKSNDDYNKSLFGILDLCVDEFLNKRKLSVSKGRLQFDQYKEICSQIAYFLLTKHRENVYSASFVELIDFIASLTKLNTRLVGEPKDIFDYIMETGILKKRLDRYTFRLNGIFEYFLAYYLKDNPKFKDEILNDDTILLSFKNELEIYSGFNRNDDFFLKNLFGKLKEKFDPVIQNYSVYGNIDKALVAKFGDVNDFTDKIKKLLVKEPIKHQIQDAIKDQVSPLGADPEVHLKPSYDTGIINYEILEKYLSIVARVFKNSDRITDQEIILEVFDYLLDAYSNMGLYLIDEFEEFAKTENLKHDAEDLDGSIIGAEVLQMIARFVPVLTQTLLYDGLGHENIKNIIKAKIEHYKKSVKENQYKLFILYFLLMDIDTAEYKNLIEDVFANVTLPALKVSTLFKLNYYLAFKAYKNKELETFYKNKIQTAQLRIDNKTDVSNLQGTLSGMSRKNLIKGQRNK